MLHKKKKAFKQVREAIKAVDGLFLLRLSGSVMFGATFNLVTCVGLP